MNKILTLKNMKYNMVPNNYEYFYYRDVKTYKSEMQMQ